MKSLSVYKHNLPVQLTSFVGRGKEMAETHRLLKGTRLLTHCPTLKILVTGREALFIPGEVTFPIPSISFHAPRGMHSPTLRVEYLLVPFFPCSDFARPRIRLRPRDPGAAPIVVAFTTFPGLSVRAGRRYTDAFPAAAVTPARKPGYSLCKSSTTA